MKNFPGGKELITILNMRIPNASILLTRKAMENPKEDTKSNVLTFI